MKHTRLNRKLISSYFTERNQQKKNAIEKQALSNPFDADALEGWNELTATDFDMRQLDEKFAPKKSSVSNKYFTLLSLALLGSGLLFFITNKKTDIKQENKRVVIEMRKNSITTCIKTETKSIVDKTIQPLTHYQAKTQEAKNTSTNSNGISKFMEMNLPYKSIERVQVSTNNTEIITSRKGAEFYMYQMKLIDYRNYRSKPIIVETENIHLGTPADRSTPTEKSRIENESMKPYTYIEFLGIGMDYLYNNQYKKASYYFNKIIDQYPEDVNALFYLGICKFQLHEYEKSISAFANVTSNQFNNFNEEAVWYSAQSLLKLNRKEEAVKLLNEIIRLNGYYSDQAKKLIH